MHSENDKLGVQDLAPGGRYLHRNGVWVRVIRKVDHQQDRVWWKDDHGAGQCARRTFLRACSRRLPDDCENPEERTPNELARDALLAEAFSKVYEAGRREGLTEARGRKN